MTRSRFDWILRGRRLPLPRMPTVAAPPAAIPPVQTVSIPTVIGTPTVGQTLTRGPGAYLNAAQVTAVWLMDSLEVADAASPITLTILHAWARMRIRETVIGLDGSVTQVFSLQTAQVAQITGTVYVAAEQLDAGIPALAPLSGTPEPVGAISYASVYNLRRKAGGGLEIASTTDFDFGYFYINAGTDSFKHEFTFAGVDKAYQIQCGFGANGNFLGEGGGTATGYVLEMIRSGPYSPTGDFNIKLKKYDGTGGKIELLTGTIANGVTDITVTVEMGPTSITCTIERSNGGDIVLNVGTESAPNYRGGTVTQYIMQKAGGGPVMTHRLGETTLTAFAEADRYALTFDESWTDPSVARFKPARPITGNEWLTRPPYWPGVINGEYQRYTDPSDPGNTGTALGRQPFAIVEEKLRIQARRLSLAEAAQYSDWGGYNTSSGQHWISGEVRKLGGHAQRYGYIEFRVKLPVGTGAWFAGWLLQEDDIWPGEIDVLEHDGDRPTSGHFALHLRNESTGADAPVPSGWLTLPGGRRIDEMHTYAVEWTPTTVTWYVDGIQTFSGSHSNLHAKMYLLISLAVGSPYGAGWIAPPNSNTPSPMTVECEHARMWQRPSQVSSVPLITAKPVISIAGTGVGAVVTITHGTSTGSVSINGFLRKGSVKIAGTDNATSYTLTSGEVGGYTINYFEEHLAAGGGKAHVNSDWVWSP